MTLRVLFVVCLSALVAAAPARAQTATAQLTAFPDFVDPALSYTLEGWQSLWLVYTGLLTYAREEGAAGTRLVPGLADALPEVSPDGRTYTLGLRQGLRYSDGTPVRASDFEHAVKRVLNLESGGSAFFLGIEGAEEYLASERAGGDISGIAAADDTGQITIRLVAADASFPWILASTWAGLVPQTTPFRNLTRSPPPGVGPFTIASSTKDKEIVLRRTPGFSLPGIPAAGVEQVRVFVEPDQSKTVGDVQLDPPLPDSPLARSPRLKRYDTASTYYLFLNRRTRPFNRRAVRQAVHYAIDKRALAREAFAGLMRPGCTFLPPALNAPERLREPCPFGERPQLARARRMIRRAGARGARVTFWSNDEAPQSTIGPMVVRMLRSIGLRARLRSVPAARYFDAIGNQRNRAQIGAANWFLDFAHPRNFMFLIDPASIQRTNNQNYGNVTDRRIGSLLSRAHRLPLDQSLPLYGQADRIAVRDAHVIPFGHRQLAMVPSERVPPECVVIHPVYQTDLSRVCIR